jgi:putative mRNA 3-end processing factor
LPARATVTKRGAVILGDSVACDAYDENMPLRVVTHAHADHLMGLRRSLKDCEKILMTKATKDMITVMKGPSLLTSRKIKPLEYGKTLKHKNDKITLLKADHILGAAQVLVENSQGERVAYTGDFRIDGTEPLECDTLVVETTYGHPSYKRNFNVDIREVLVSMVEKRLRLGTVYVFGFHGKLQEVMQILTNADVTVPFVMPENVYNVSKVCAHHGMKLGCITLSTKKEAKELLEKNLPCVAFYHVNSRRTVGLDNDRICVSGWEFRSPSRQTGFKEHVVALSDHSDFNGLIEYVKRCKPKKVVTDNYRGDGEILAKEITKRLCIPAIPAPGNGTRWLQQVLVNAQDLKGPKVNHQ